MTYKIIFSDIDGTLLNKDRELSALTVKVICELQKKVPVILISSRMPQALRQGWDLYGVSIKIVFWRLDKQEIWTISPFSPMMP